MPTLFPSLPKFSLLAADIGFRNQDVASLGHTATGDDHGALVLLDAGRDAIGETAADNWSGHTCALDLAVANCAVYLELLSQRRARKHGLPVSPDPFLAGSLSAASDYDQPDNQHSSHAVLPDWQGSIADHYAERE